jgi:SAM-dependent methyltransferase
MGTDMTQRGASTLSANYGFESVEACAGSLASGAHVLDAGAGASTFGQTLATMRPDIHWTNLDIGYTNTAALAALQEGAPSNLTFVTGDIRRATQLFPHSIFDVVFSYWALNYLVGNHARRGIRQLLDVTRPTGRLSVGALVGMADPLEPGVWKKNAQTITLSPSEDPSFQEAVVIHISAALKYPQRVLPLQGVTYAPIIGKDLVQ